MDFLRIDLEVMVIILLFLGSMGFFKVILYLYYVLVIFVCYCVNVYYINNEDVVFYNDRVFFWVVGYLCWEIGGGKI